MKPSPSVTAKKAAKPSPALVLARARIEELEQKLADTRKRLRTRARIAANKAVKPDSSLARKSAALAMSFGSPKRPIGSVRTTFSRGRPPITRSTIGVSITPGQMQFTRMFLSAYSSAARRVRLMTPAFAAA